MKKLNLVFYYVLLIIYLELIFKGFAFHNIWQVKTLYIILFSLPISGFLYLISTFFSEKANKIITIFITFLLCFIFESEFIYYLYYKAIFSFNMVGVGNQIMDFIDSILEVMLNNIIVIILLILPFILLLIFIKKLNFEKMRIKVKLLILLVIVNFYLIGISSLYLEKADLYSAKSLYFKTNMPLYTADTLGLMTELRLDIQRSTFGFKEKTIIDDPIIDDPVIEDPDDKPLGYNVMEIDFDGLISKEKNNDIKGMHEYFKNVSPTAKNKYTGMFKGKNLIVFVAEGLSYIAADPVLTPTLYHLVNSGFVFNNFYTPIYYASTSDGEYHTDTSLLPVNGGGVSMKRTVNNYLPFVLGNAFKRLDYNTRAYHDHTYSYYDRNLTHPNLGYTYKGCGNGIKMDCSHWPNSDYDMIKGTTPEYINNDKYMTYYMTVSGHLRYNFVGNYIAMKNKSKVANLPYSDAVKAYMATQMELDKALEELIKELKANNTLDNTVIALSADHYPYGLTSKQIAEKADYNVDKFNLHKDLFVLWNSSMEKVVVDKYASSLDVLPTILNLFGVEYDSRLLIGRDLLADDKSLVIFNDRSFITEKGRYDAKTKKFESFGEPVSQEYIDAKIKEVYNKFTMSKLVLEKNYYAKVFPNGL